MQHFILEIDKPISFGSPSTSSESPLELLAKTQNSNFFQYILSYIQDFWGADFASYFPFLTINNLASHSPLIPTIVHSIGNISDLFLFSQSENSEFYMVTNSNIRVIFKILNNVILKHVRFMLFFEKLTPQIISFLTDSFSLIQESPVHNNFRLFIITNDIDSLPFRLIILSRRISSDKFNFPRRTVRELYSNYLNDARSTLNQLIVGKITYGSALLFSLLGLRLSFSQIGFSFQFPIFFNTFSTFFHFYSNSENSEKNIIFLRDWYFDMLLSPVILNDNDKRIAQILTLSVFRDNFCFEQFIFRPEFDRSDKYQIPHDISALKLNELISNIPCTLR